MSWKGDCWLLQRVFSGYSGDAQIVDTGENTSLPFDSQLLISQQENKFK